MGSAHGSHPIDASAIDTNPQRPPYWREVAVTAPAIFALIIVISALFSPALRQLPDLAATAFTVLLVVMAMTKPVMPTIMRIFHRFLFPDRR